MSSDERNYYSRHLSLPEVGATGQQKLKHARVLVIGAGGLGCPMLTYLAAAGVGTLGIVDFDQVEVSNLHRQVLFGMADVGRYKAEAARERLQALNPHIAVEAHVYALNPDNALSLISQYDLVVDGSDNFPTRYLVNDACVLTNKPLIFGSIYKFEGQISVFNFQGGPTYRCLYPTPPQDGEIPNCAEIGVLGVLPGVVGSLMATEAIKLILGLGKVLSGKLLVYDALEAGFRTYTFTAKSASRAFDTLQSDYGPVCALPSESTLEELDWEELQALLDSPTPPLLIDVREPAEYQRFNIGGVNWPLRTLTQHLPDILPHRQVVLCCQSGQRSRKAWQILSDVFPEYNFAHVKGGLSAIGVWS
ncbi:molybdopterin-synthase adenylyltransferase MoeB [Arundinibacter roseus]|uniref:Molybdopterin-synthase adenylyltransferase n=1 Tax=Arundinibacter roseus TaxID=2070510 RepID=A0A4R4KDU8_9BACT|nr:molybdopterin-synthase adenylyltransferase MoeB [Arundinibacter roseus]